jgi:hypothetical protein
VRGFAAAFSVFALLALTLPFTGWPEGAVAAIACAIGSGIGFTLTVVSRRHLRTEPWGELRDNHTQVVERLNYGTSVGDGHYLDDADLSGFADFFDGE